MAAPLASVADLEGRLGRSLSSDDLARAELLLKDASAAVRSYTGQLLSVGTSTVRAVPQPGGRVRLSQRPVTAVTSVVVATPLGTAVPFEWSGDVVTLGSWWVDGWYPLRTDPAVDVTYTHGYAPGMIPDAVVAVVCQMAGRAMGRPADQTSRQSESIAGYSYSILAASAAGPFGLLNDEKAVLDGFRRSGGTVFLL